MKPLVLLVCAVGLLSGSASAQRPVNITLTGQLRGPAIPADFVGLSFEISNLLPDQNGKYLFSATNRPLINLFRTIGIKSLRVGGGTAELPNYRDPALVDIDQLFAFARATDVKVIYTLRLLNGNKTHAAAVTAYIAGHYRAHLACFSIGNEPDWHAYHSYPGHELDPAISEATPGVPGSAYPSFLVKWRSFARAIDEQVPDALFGGPDTGSNHPVPGARDTEYRGRSWTEQFVRDERGPRLYAAFLHDYVGQGAKGISIDRAIESMLSRGWLVTNYAVLFEHVLAPIKAQGVSYRMTECNDYTGGVDGASNGFVSALWALDYMHWHAAHGAAGVNFHNKRWIRTCTIYLDRSGQFQIRPKAYGLKAFNLGSNGRVESSTLDNPDSVNLTAYAVANDREHIVTLINKEHGPGAAEAKVALTVPVTAQHATMLLLTAPDGKPSATIGVTLGGGTISADEPWSGTWQCLAPVQPGKYELTVPPLAAAIVRFSIRDPL